MKNYELINILMSLPAGYNIAFGKKLLADDHDEPVDLYITGSVIGVSQDDDNKTLTLAGK